MPRPTLPAIPNDPPVLGDPDFAANAQGYLGWFPDFADYTEAMADWFETGFAKELTNGTAALPSMAFASDPNTGFYRVGADTIGASTGGVVRWSLSNTAMAINVPITGTAVVSNNTDTTPGRVPTVGWMGLGSAAPPTVTDLNTISETGFYQIAVGNAVSGNAPTTHNYVVLHTAFNLTNSTQIAQRIAIASPEVWTRVKNSGGWSSWQRVLTNDRLLGTVSQSSGVPTGAVIERGSNANGEYVRFADGTQICSVRRSASATEPVGWTFPAAFSGAVPAIIGSVEAGGVPRIFTYGSLSTTSVNFWAWSGTAQVDSQCSVTAIGRWF